MEDIGIQEVGEDIIVGKDYGIRGGDMVSYAEWGKYGAVKNVGE